MIDIAKRRRLVALLTESAELEHALLCQYLYAAFSFKRRPEEGVTWRQLELMRQWEASITLIARQEMEHLGLVSNLLTAIGEAPWLNRPNLPLAPRHYHLNVDARLERLNEESLVRFALFEIPDQPLASDHAKLLAEAHGAPVDPGHHQTIERLYDEIRQLFQDLGEELFIGPPGAQLATAEVIPVGLSLRGVQLPATGRFYDVQLEPVIDIPSALAVVKQIQEEGEGAPGATQGSHFTRVLTVLRQLLSERRDDPDFEPARPVTAHPSPHDIADPRTRRASEFFDHAYETLLLLLMRFFAHSDERTAELTGLQRAAFMPMMTTVMRPLGELLTELPTGSDPPGSTAGPVFRFTRNITLLPHRRAAWKVIQGELNDLAASAQALAADSGYPAGVRTRLELMRENLGRIALDFEIATGPAVVPQPTPPPPPPPVVKHLVLAFEGWCSLRLPTDPDPCDEPRGVSGYTFAFAGEPDFDNVLNLQPRAGATYRSHGPPLGVTVRSAVRTNGRPMPALNGARVDLLGGPILQNRNWTMTLPGYEPIVPFDLRIDGDGVALERAAVLNPADPSQPLWQIPQAQIEAHGARGIEFEPATVGEATGMWDPLAVVTERLALLNADRDRGGDPTAMTALDGRIAELEFALKTPTDRRVGIRSFVERFGFTLVGNHPVVEGDATALGGMVDTTTPWRVDFWLGGWDPDLLCVYMKGVLNVPYAA